MKQFDRSEEFMFRNYHRDKCGGVGYFVTTDFTKVKN